MPSPSTSAAIEAQARLRRLTVTAVTTIWRDLPAYNRENLPEWLSQVVPVILTAQRASVSLTDAYLARAMERQPFGLDIDSLTGAGVRNGADPKEVYERPFITIWSKLGEGVAFEDAVSAGLARAAGSAAMDVQLSMRASASAVQETDDGIYGYERAADPGACNFCGEVDGAYVKNADAMALHNNCGCGLEPLIAPHPRAAKLPSGVAVHQHGELGPMLGAPGDHFTSEHDI